MNFLSHYYLHRDPEDNYFTVGLTVPDLLGFHTRRVRVTKKYLKNFLEKENDARIISHIHGMMLHLDLDRWFHNSDFFKEKIIFLQNSYINFNSEGSDLPHFYAHIILEILLDRYLLMIEPDIADNFYDSYKRFNFSDITRIFRGLENFSNDKFILLADNVSHSTFLKEYIDNYSIINILTRVSNRIEIPMGLNPDRDEFADYIQYVYNELEKPIEDFFIRAKAETAIKEREVIVSNFMVTSKNLNFSL